MAVRTNWTTEVLKEICKNIQRVDKGEDGIYDHAVFEYDNHYYYVMKDGRTYRWIKKHEDWQPIGGYCKRKIYPQVTIGKAQIKTYVLAMACLTDWFLDAYVSDNKLVVNHTVADCVKYDTGSVGYPKREVEANPQYLELVTQSENTRHGSFVHEYGLFGVYVSAKDVEKLKELFKTSEAEVEAGTTDYAHLVEKYYRGMGETKQIIFG